MGRCRERASGGTREQNEIQSSEEIPGKGQTDCAEAGRKGTVNGWSPEELYIYIAMMDVMNSGLV